MLQPFPHKAIKWQDQLILLIIVLTGALLRFYYLEGPSLSNDELSAITRLRFDTFHDLIEYGVKPDGHPAGIQVFLWFWVKWFGDSAISVRLPFAIFGSLAIIATFGWARIWFGKWPAYFTAASLALLQYPLFYSQLARPYAAGLFFVMLLTWFWTLIITGKKGRMYYVAFSVTAALCAYTHYFSFLTALILGLLGLFYVPKESLKWYVLSGFGAVLLYLPHTPVLLAQLKLGGLEWLGPPTKRFLFDYIFEIFNESWLILVAALGIFLYSLFYKSGKESGLRPWRILALLMFLLPFLVGYFKSVWGKPVLQYSTLIFSFPFLPAFLFSWTGRLAKRLKYLLLASWSLLCIISLLLEKRYYQTENYGQFKPLAEKVLEWNDVVGERNITNAVNLNNPYYFQYYYNHWNKHVDFAIWRLDDPDSLDRLFNIVSASRTPYFSYAYSNIAHPWEVEAIIGLKYKQRIYFKEHFSNAAISLFKADTADLHDLRPVWQMQNDSGSLYAGPIGSSWQGRLLKISCNAEIDSLSPDAELVVSAETAGKVYDWKTIHLADRLQKPDVAKTMVWFTSVPQRKTPADTMKIYIWNHSPALVKVHKFAAGIY